MGINSRSSLIFDQRMSNKFAQSCKRSFSGKLPSQRIDTQALLTINKGEWDALTNLCALK